jgi:hypothetical protein
MALYRYTFQADVPKAEVEASLLLALIAVEGLHGEAQTRLDAGHALGGKFGTCVIDAGTPVGRDLAKVFTAFLRREFGEDSFRVERLQPIQPQSQPTTQEATK